MGGRAHKGILHHHYRNLGAGVSCLALALLGVLATRPAFALVFNNNVAPNTAAAANIYDVDNIYSNVVSVGINMPSGSGQCTGTLINSRTILTASHCMWNAATETFSDIKDISIGFSPEGRAGTSPNDQTASGVLIRSDYLNARFGNDIALISLSTPVTSIAPVQVVSDDAAVPAKGMQGVIVGYGQYGTGLDAGLYYDPKNPDLEAPGDGRRRFGQTVVGDYTYWTFDRTGDIPIIVAQFRNPDSPTNPDMYGLAEDGIPVPELQAGNGGGDSGGPLFLVMEDGSLVQYGILGLLYPSPDETLRYGVVSGWEFIQNYSDWMAENNPLRITSARAGSFNWSNANAWVDTNGYREVPDNIEGSFAGPFGAVGRYYDVSLTHASNIRVDMSPTVDSLSIAHQAAVLNILPESRLTTVLDTQILTGEIVANGVLATQLLSLQGGYLSGTGSVEVANGLQHMTGAVAPGTSNALGTLSLSGDYQAEDAAVLSVRLGAGGADQFAVSGKAQLNGTLQYGLFSPARFGTYVVATAQDGFSGSFDNIAGPASIFTSVEAVYAENSISLSVEKVRNFVSAGISANQIAVGAALDGMNESSTLFASAAWLPSAAAANRAFDQMSGQAYASLETVLLQDSRFTRETALGRLRTAAGGVGGPSASVLNYADDGQISNKPLPGTGTDVWMQGFGTFGDISANNGSASVKRDIGGFYAGADRVIFNDWRLGILGGYSRTTAFLRDLAASFSSDNYSIGLYGGRQWGALSLKLGVSQTWHDISAARSPALPTIQNNLEAGFNATTGQVFGELGYHMTMGGLALEPFANLAYVSIGSNAIAESGGVAALWTSGLGGDATFSTLGLRLSAPVFVQGETRISAHASAGWQHAWNGQTPALAASFTGSSAFISTGTPLAQDTALLEAGLDSDLADNIRVGVFYSGQFGDGISDNGFQAALNVRF